MQWLLDHFVTYIEQGVVYVINACIASLGAFLSTIAGLLPNMPSQPTLPSQLTGAVRVAYEVCDVGWLLAYTASFFALLAVVFLVMIPLRWIKAAD